MAIASNPKLPVTGRNVVLTIFVGGTPLTQTDVAQSISITEVVQQYRDKYLGRDRDRPDEQTTGYDATISLHYTGSQLVQALFAQKTARQTLQPVPLVSIGLTVANRDGTYDGYLLQNCTAKIAIDFRGKEDRGMINLSLQAEDLRLTQSL